MKFISLAASLLVHMGANAYAPSLSKTRSLTSFQLEARRPFITGNWKLNPQTKDEAIKLAGAIAQTITPSSPDCDVAIFTPYVFLESAMQAVGGKLLVGAEVSHVCQTVFRPPSPNWRSLCLTYFSLLGSLPRDQRCFHWCCIGQHAAISRRSMGLGWSFRTSCDFW
jgi:Triosephosphate isomerase